MGSKSRRGQRFLVGAGVFVLVAGILVFILATAQQNSLSAKVAAARKVGYPFEGKSLVPNPPFPNAMNAAPYYEQAINTHRSLASRPAGEKAVGEILEGLDEKGRKDLDAYFADLGPTLDFVWQGTQADYCYFPKDWDKGAAVLFPEYAYLKSIAKAQAARGYFAALAGQDAKSIEDFATVHKLAEHISQQPILIALLVSIAIDAINARFIEATFPLALKSESDSRWIRGRIEAMPEKWDLTGSLRTEAFFMWWMTEQGRDLPALMGYAPSDPPSVEITLMTRSQFVVRAVKSSVLDIYTPAVRDYKPGDDETTALDALERRALAVQEASTFAGPVISAFIPTFRGMSDGLNRARARRRSLLAALDVLDHRRKTGAWPSALPAGYADPYDGKPLRYMIDGEGFRIWSVGADRVDDKGKSDRELKSGSHDEVLIYPRPN